MKTNFTKGPWQINDRDPSQICDSDGDVRGCAPIATVHGTAAEQKANAALIVSAPELYEALSRVLTAPPSEFATASQFQNWARLFAEPALKKARGEV